jgi:sugar lactone lactonase YvrE
MRFSMFTAGATALAACSGGSSSTTAPPPQTGSLTVTVTASASGTPGVTVTGPSGFHTTIHATLTLTGLAPGSYTVSGGSVVTINSIVASVFTPSVTGSPATVAAGDTAVAAVAYLQRPGTGGLWVGDYLNGVVAQYPVAQLITSTSPPPAVVLAAPGGSLGACAFDAAGNLWIANYGTITEFTAAQLASSGTPAPAVTLQAVGGTSTNVTLGLTFDSNGNLWVARTGVSDVVAYAPSQLSVSGSPQPMVTLTSNVELGDLTSIAFDASGDMWIIGTVHVTTGVPQDVYALLEFTPNQLAAGGIQSPAVIVESHSFAVPTALAFDKSGDLWVADGGEEMVMEFTPGQIEITNMATPTVTLSSPGNPSGLAFDASGDLWVANLGTGVNAFEASQLVAGGSPRPAVTITVSSHGEAMSLAFDP